MKALMIIACLAMASVAWADGLYTDPDTGHPISYKDDGSYMDLRTGHQYVRTPDGRVVNTTMGRVEEPPEQKEKDSWGWDSDEGDDRDWDD